jgi:competence protein ComEA
VSLWALWAIGALAGPLDVNAATADELDALGGLGPVKARAIVEWREDNGPCTDLDELREVPGIGAATFAAIAPHLRCGTGPDEDEVLEPSPPLEGRAPAAVPVVVDVNRATAEELTRLPGVVPERARAIVEDRERNGPFASCDELVRVEGFGPATVAVFGDRCTAD